MFAAEHLRKVNPFDIHPADRLDLLEEIEPAHTVFGDEQPPFRLSRIVRSNSGFGNCRNPPSSGAVSSSGPEPLPMMMRPPSSTR